MFDEIKEYQVWLIYLLPLASFALIAAHYLLPAKARPAPRVLSAISILAVGVSFLLALWALKAVSASDDPGTAIGFGAHRWIEAGPLRVEVGIRLDGLTAVMLVIVTSVALVVQFYSQGYMEGDPGYPRFYAELSLFTAAMLGLVLASSMVMLFIHWELVGLCSYLLIGYWFANPPRPGYTSPADAAKKAFIVTRVGDLGLLIAILLIWTRTNTFNIREIQDIAQGLVPGKSLSSGILTLFALGVFAGAAGKSAQFPFHVWLPDAMEGPTPVSALIHAATMVAAGVYLVARLFPVYEASHDAMNVVAGIGAATALIAATMGLVMQDIKRVLAYSTISQLGYMMLALGSGGLVAGIFHLMNHAFFKAMLFLGSGSVSHGTGTFDMQKMGGLRRVMPVTFATFVIGSLSLGGIPPFSGFWSKDEILLDAWHFNRLAFAVALFVAFLTAFYMFRAIFLTFFGEYRGGEPTAAHGVDAVTDALADGGDAPHGGHEQQPAAAHEAPWVMWLPLVALAVPSVISGLLNAGGPLGHPFGEFVKGSLPETLREGQEHAFIPMIAVVSSAFAVFGAVLAGALYGLGWRLRVVLPNVGRPLYTLFAHKYYLDDLYNNVIVGGLLYGGVWRLAAWFDATVIDGIVNGAAWVTRRVGAVLRRAQTGSEQSYGLALTGGAALVVLVIFISALR